MLALRRIMRGKPDDLGLGYKCLDLDRVTSATGQIQTYPSNRLAERSADENNGIVYLKKIRSNVRCGGGRAAAMAGGSAAKPTPLR